MKKTCLFLLFLFSLTFLISSCADPNISTKNTKLHLPFVSEYETVSDSVDGAILVQQSRDSLLRGADTSSSLNYVITAEFNTSDGDVDGGTLQFNGTTIDQQSGTHYYTSPEEIHLSGPTYGATFNGTQDVFYLSGSSSFPSFRDTLVSPKGSIMMTAPYTGHSISKSANLLVTWSGTRDSTSGIAIVLRDTSGASLSKLTSDNGSYTINSSELSTFSTTNSYAYITIYKYKYKIKTLSDRKIGIVEVSHHTKNVTFTN